MKLDKKKTFIVRPKAPFHFDGTFHKPAHFPNKLKLDEWQPSKYWRALRIDKTIYGLRIENLGKIFQPKLRISVYSDKVFTKKEIEKLKKEIIWRSELNTDLREFYKLAKKDARFYPVFRKWLGMRNASQETLYELLIIAIVLQNATVRRSQQMLDALLGKFGTKVEFDGEELWAIWLPQRLKKVLEGELRDLKIGYRAKFIRRLSEDFISGKVDEYKLRGMDKESAQKELRKLYGVGPETTRILLFETLHHYDVFDHIAPWQQKIYSRLFYGRKLVPAGKIQSGLKKSYGKYTMLAAEYIFEDVFWRRKNEKIPWLEKEIRL